MEPGYGERYRELYARHWWWRAREKLVLQELDAVCPTGGWRHALDVGCGDGLFFPQLKGYAERVEGVEPDAALVSEPDHPDGLIHVRSFDATFLPDRRYGLVLFLDVLEHIPDAEEAVRHTVELMEEGGVLLVTVPAFLHLWTTHDELNHHVTRYTRASLTGLLAPHFTVLRTRYFFRWVHPAKIAQRILEGVSRRTEPTLPSLPQAPMNRLLYGISRLEDKLFGRLPVPLGSSILAVARKAGPSPGPTDVG